MSEDKRSGFSLVIALALLLAIVALILSGLVYRDAQRKLTAAPQAETVVRAHRFEVLDANGIVRAELLVLNDGPPCLKLWDEREKPVAILQTQQPDKGRARLALMDARGKSRCDLSVAADGSPRMLLYDENGQTVFSAP